MGHWLLLKLDSCNVYIHCEPTLPSWCLPLNCRRHSSVVQWLHVTRVRVCVCVCVCEIGFCILNYMSWNCPDFTHCTLNFIKLLNFVNKKAQYLISVLKRPLCTRAPCTWHDALTPEDSQSHIKVIMSFNSTYYVPRLCHPPDCDCQRP